MIDYETMRTAIANGLKQYLGCPVIRSNQNQEPPEYPYLSYTITTLMSENNGTYGVYSDGYDRQARTQTWSITVQSDDNSECIDLVCKAHEWLERTGNIYLNDNNVIVQSVGSITNRDNFLTTEYEYRNGFDVVFWMLDTVKSTITGDEAETIETFELNTKVEEG